MADYIWECRYFITAADYTAFPELSLMGKTKKVIQEFREEILAFYEKNHIAVPVGFDDDNRFIILWRDLPKTIVPNNTEDSLFRACCYYDKKENGEKRTSPDTIAPFYVNIRNSDTLAAGSVPRFIQRYCLMNKCLHIRPVVYDLDLIPDDLSLFLKAGEIPDVSFPDEDAENYDQRFQEAIAEFDRQDEEKDIQLEQWSEATAKERTAINQMLSFLDTMYEQITQETITDESKDFLYYYWQWQLGKIGVEPACRELNNMSKRSFYNYVYAFESHPYYVEYQKILFPLLADKAKKGALQFDTEQMYSDILELYPNADFQFLAPGVLIHGNYKNDFTAEYALCDKYNLSSLLELSRAFLAVKQKKEKGK